MNYCLNIFIENIVYTSYFPLLKLDIINTITDSSFTADSIYRLLKYFVIPLLIVIIFSLILFLIINRYVFEKLVIPREKLEIKIDDFLTELVFSEYTSKEIKLKINHFKEVVPFNKKWCRDLIFNKIITIKQNVFNTNSNQLLLIYKDFGFQEYSKKLIKSRKWYKKTAGIYHYQMLDYKIKKGYIKAYVNSKNKFLKSNSLIALISLSDERFDILKNYQEKISKADELKILDIIYQKKSSLPKKINDWLDNENSSIVVLAIKLMIRYHQTLKLSQIEFLLAHPNKTVRKETLLAIREQIIMDANDLLIDHYAVEINKRNKISTLKTLGIIGNTKTKFFAAGILLKENDLEIKFEIINCINKIDTTYFKNLQVENKIESEIINRIVLHVNTPYLN